MNKKRSYPEYRVWAGMWTRCTNEKESCFKYYGGRGIKVCDRWKSFENFYLDMGPRPEGFEIDRRNNDGNYEPENCRWVSKKQNAQNKSNNHFIEYNGEIKTLSEWATITGIIYPTILYRLKLKWTVAQALGFEEKKWDRSHKRVLFEYKGQKKYLTEWSEILGIKRSTLAQRIYVCGWDIEKAFTKGAKN